MELTIQQYKDAIQYALPKMRQIQFLKDLYLFPNSTATPDQMSELTFGHRRNGANLRIGVMGKIFSSYVSEPLTGKEQYYHFISDKKIGGAWVMHKNLQRALEELGYVGKDSNDRMPTEILPFKERKLYSEGKVIGVFVNRYERSQDARRECIKHYGCACQACGINSVNIYGELVE